MKITEADVEYVAKLANLEVAEDEKRELAEQLSSIVDYIEQLNKLDVSSVAPTTQILEGVKHACGHDVLVPFSCKQRGICPSCGARRMCDEQGVEAFRATLEEVIDRVFTQEAA